MDGEQAWTENKRGRRTSVFFFNGYERSARQAVWLESGDLNKAWTRTKRGLEQSVDLNKAWT